MTVLSRQNDPYRLDTPANHEKGKWLADAYAEVNPEGRRLHLRGLHYALVGRVDCLTARHTSTRRDIIWPSEKAAESGAVSRLSASGMTLRDARNDATAGFHAIRLR